MRVPNYNLGVKGDECQCGRRATVVHCPVCGSTRRYARSNRMHKYLDGEERFIKVEYRCMTCGHLYVEEERALCEAPPIGNVLATQRVRALHDASQTGEYLNPVEKKAAKSIANALRQGKTDDEVEQVANAPVVLSSDELKKIRFQIRHAYMDHLLEFNTKKRTDHPGEVEAYIERGLKQLYPNLQVESETEAKNVEG